MISKNIFSVKFTDRIKRLKQALLDTESEICTERAILVTKMYQEKESLPVIVKRALALREVLKNMTIFINKDELIVGHHASKLRGVEVFPEMSVNWISRELDHLEKRENNQLKITEENKNILKKIYPYWNGKTVCDRIETIRPRNIRQSVECGLISNTHQWNGLGHAALTYGMRRVLNSGYSGIKKEILKRRNRLDITAPNHLKHKAFYEAAAITCDAVMKFSRRYSELAKNLSTNEKDPKRRHELQKISEICERVPTYPARNYYEALQSLWFVQFILHIEQNGFANSPGRVDQYIYPYYKNDIEKGMLTQNEAQELLDCLWLKFNEILRVDDQGAAEINIGYAVSQNLVIGGLDSYGKDATNELSYMCLLANTHVGLGQPNFSARLHKKTPKEFLDRISETISYGNGMPQLYNDEVIIPGLLNLNLGISLQKARNYTPTGCVELVVEDMWNRGNGGYYNLPKVLEITMNNGRCALTSKESGLLNTKYSFDKVETFEKFLKIFKDQMSAGIRILVAESNNIDIAHEALAPLPFLSTLYTSAIDRGLDVTQGGEARNFSSPVGFGFATLGDSLLAIKKIVYEEKRISFDKFIEVLNRNYENDESLRQYIINKVPKFGNDCNEVDDLVRETTDFFFDELEKYRNTQGNKMVPGIFSVTAQVGLGYKTAATPDGRLSKTPLSDGLSPMFGRDILGPTATLNSLTKMDLMRSINGIIINQRLDSTILKNKAGLEKFGQLLRSFIKIGGFHWQFNVVSSETLKDAQINPLNYKDLVVRVAGFSALFTQLSKTTQDSIIARTESIL